MAPPPPETQSRAAPLAVAVLISGGGTTLKNLLNRISDGSLPARVALVVSSRSDAGGLRFAAEAGVPAVVVRRRDHADDAAFGAAVFDACRAAGIELVAMGGFLKYLPIADDFVGRVLNIHPSLIPAFCGQGFYGLRVHQAVLDYGAKVSGCTVHFVDHEYDHGPIVLQRTVPVLDDDDAASLQQRVFTAECEAYPEALRLFAAGRLRLDGRRVRIAPAQ